MAFAMGIDLPHRSVLECAEHIEVNAAQNGLLRIAASTRIVDSAERARETDPIEAAVTERLPMPRGHNPITRSGQHIVTHLHDFTMRIAMISCPLYLEERRLSTPPRQMRRATRRE